MLTTSNMKKLLFIFIIFLSFSGKAAATGVFITVPEKINVGDNFEVLINADTGGELINSVDMAIDYPEDLISFAGYKNDETIIRFWIESPSEKDGKIYFSGIVPGGVAGLYDANKIGLGTLPVARLLFVAKQIGSSEVSFLKTKILKNDGKGTPILHNQSNAQVTIIKTENDNPKNNSLIDKASPESFEIAFVKSSIFSATPGMLIFRATDIGSGIKQYKIKTSALGWQETKSPQAVSQGIFPKNITIRAFDFYGNYKDVGISIPGLLPLNFLLASFALLLFGILSYKLLKYKL